MNRNQALADGIEFDLTHFHRHRMARRAGLQMQLLRDARNAQTIDEDRVAMLRKALSETGRNRFNTVLTVEEVIQPLRCGVEISAIALADAYMADPVNQRPCQPSRAV
ncbi:hypothetical protein [Pseudoxanthomonas sp. JBR18]|uniref:hypothetical protein n=1 Tax=Pseudoxanthomonas sp. JBR18 TaxID=2969308 RepID=UPI0023069C28|nr:hypothetical protein [Pseudoxanthomonas sp. JBR18]WCE03846.1 hypothetical protein PJ250_17430 [Pseudoxanthomonas sp. JBR18]